MIKVIVVAATIAVAISWVGASSALADEGPRVHRTKVRHVCHGPRCGPYMPCGYVVVRGATFHTHAIPCTVHTHLRRNRILGRLHLCRLAIAAEPCIPRL